MQTNMADKTLNEAQSLELITRMIQNTRQRMERNAGRPFLIWGYLTIATALAVWYAISRTHNYNWNLLWFAMPVIGSSLMWLTRSRKPAGVTTFIDRIVGQIWLVLGLTALLVSALAMFSSLHLHILFIILLLMGIGTTLSGLVIRFRACIVGGVLGIGLSILCLWFTPLNSYLFFAGAFFVIMVVPGHILNYQSNHTKAE